MRSYILLLAAGVASIAVLSLSACGAGLYSPLFDASHVPVPDTAIRYVRVGDTYALSASGAMPPYTYTLTSGPGSVAADGTYTAPSSISGNYETAFIRISDWWGRSTDVTMYVSVPSTLDTSFGSSSTAIFDIDSGQTVTEVAMQPDGAVLVGITQDTTSVLVKRVKSDGSGYDLTFGTNGSVSLAVATALHRIKGLHVDRWGYIYVAFEWEANTGSGRYWPVVAKLDAGGALVASYGSGGFASALSSLSIDGAINPGGFLVDETTGEVYLGGNYYSPTVTYSIFRLTSEGVIDTNWGTGGRVLAPSESLFWMDDGRLAGCSRYAGGFTAFAGTDWNFAGFAIFDANGALAVWHHETTVTTDQYPICLSLPDGHVVMAGRGGAGSATFRGRKYTSTTLARDTTFGTAGVYASPQAFYETPFNQNLEGLYRISQQVVYAMTANVATKRVGYLGAFDSLGVEDATYSRFLDIGMTGTQIDSTDMGRDGRVILLSTLLSENKFALTRFWP